jgi:hypothetical protein
MTAIATTVDGGRAELGDATLAAEREHHAALTPRGEPPHAASALRNDTALMQNLRPLGAGPSGNT